MSGKTSVTQATNKATAVTINKQEGEIVTTAASLADATTVTFQVNNSKVTAEDNVIVNHKSGGTLGAYVVQAHTIATGSFKISIRNVSGGALLEALTLSFDVERSAYA